MSLNPYRRDAGLPGIRLRPWEREAIDEACEAERVTVSELVRAAVREYLERLSRQRAR